MSKHGVPGCCPGCCARRILADIEVIRQQQEYEARRREQAYMR